MTTNDDALEVAKVLGNKLRPVYAFAAIMVATLGGGVSYVWQLADFINRDAVHETQQDENMLTMKKKMDELEKGVEAARERNLAVVKLLITDLAKLRSVQLETLKPNRRKEVRKDFEAQRINGINLLVDLQMD